MRSGKKLKRKKPLFEAGSSWIVGAEEWRRRRSITRRVLRITRKLEAVKGEGDLGECLETSLCTQGVRRLDVIGILKWGDPFNAALNWRRRATEATRPRYELSPVVVVVVGFLSKSCFQSSDLVDACLCPARRSSADHTIH